MDDARTRVRSRDPARPPSLGQVQARNEKLVRILLLVAGQVGRVLPHRVQKAVRIERHRLARKALSQRSDPNSPETGVRRDLVREGGLGRGSDSRSTRPGPGFSLHPAGSLSALCTAGYDAYLANECGQLACQARRLGRRGARPRAVEVRQVVRPHQRVVHNRLQDAVHEARRPEVVKAAQPCSHHTQTRTCAKPQSERAAPSRGRLPIVLRDAPEHRWIRQRWGGAAGATGVAVTTGARGRLGAACVPGPAVECGKPPCAPHDEPVATQHPCSEPS